MRKQYKKEKTEIQSAKKFEMLDILGEMTKILMNPSKAKEHKYEMKQTLQISYIAIFFSLLVVLILRAGVLDLGVLLIALLFLVFYAFFVLTAIVAGSSIIWISSLMLNVKSEFEKQTNAMVSIGTPLIILLCVIEILSLIAAPIISVFNLVILLYGLYAIISVVKHINDISWVKALLITLWPLMFLLIVYLILSVTSYEGFIE